MDAIGYYIFYGINWVITLLPLRVLYIFSDLIFVLLYYFPSYRRKVVMKILKIHSPKKVRKKLKLSGKNSTNILLISSSKPSS